MHMARTIIRVTDTPEPTMQATLAIEPPVVTSVGAEVQANVIDGATAWIVIVALAGITAIAYISKTNAALLADSVPREFATFILSGGDALVDVASNLADGFDDYVKKTETQLDDQALAFFKGFIDNMKQKNDS